MKKLIIFRMLVFCSVIFFGFSCKEKNEEKQCREIEKPNDLKTIDWDNYNDVYTVHWNYVGDCSNVGYTEQTIKVAGWLMQPGGNLMEISSKQFHLTDKPNQYLYSEGVTMIVTPSYEIADALKIKFNNNDLTKRCYVSGRLFIESFPINFCCRSQPIIILTDVNDIKFE